jgi:hypothetical protein
MVFSGSKRIRLARIASQKRNKLRDRPVTMGGYRPLKATNLGGIT